MANENKRTHDPRRAAMERTSVRVISAGRDQQKHKKQQDRLSRQEQKMAEKLERQEQKATQTQQSRKPVFSRTANKEQTPAPRAEQHKTKQPLKTVSAKETMSRMKNGFQVIAGGRRTKLVRWTGIVALVIAAVIIINAVVPIGMWEYIQNVLAGTGTGDGFPVAVSSSDSNHILSVGSDIALLGDSSLMLYKSNGKLLADRQHGYSDPAFTACSARVLVYNRGGKGLRMENRAKTLFSLEAKGAITTASMADNGTFAVVTRGSDYISDVTAYNASGKEKFVWHSSSRQVTAVALSDNGRYMAVTTLHVEGGESVTGIMMFDTRKGTTMFEENAKGSMPVSLDVKGTTAVAVLSNCAVAITKTGKRTDFSYDGGTLTCFDNHNDFGTVLVLAMYQDTHNNRLLVLDKNLKVSGQSDLQQEALAVSAKGSAVTILADGQVLFCNRKAIVRKEVLLETDARTLLCKGNRAILLGSDRLEEIQK